MANDLTISIQESITLPNGNKEILQNTKIIPGINQVLRRIDTIASIISGSGIEILRFVNSEEEQTAGSFIKDQVQYIRITNLDSTNFVTIYLIEEDGYDGESVSFKVLPGRSLLLSNADFDASEYQDYVYENTWDLDYYSDFSKASVIKAKADTANVQLEYFVAST